MNKGTQLTVFVVDDDAAVRDSIAELVESVGLASEVFPSARAFLETFDLARPGCLVLDVRMAEMSGLTLLKRLKDLGPQVPVVMLTGHADVPIAVQAMKAGAIDFIQKPYRDQALLDSIHLGLSLAATAAHATTTGVSFEASLDALTERERQVLDQVLAGKTSKGIAEALTISPRTAELHRRNLVNKLGFASTKELRNAVVTRKRDT